MAALAFVRFTFGGTLAGSEQWACGVSFETTTAPTAADLTAWLGSMNTPLVTWWTAAGGPFTLASSDTVLKDMRAAYYPAGATTASTTAARPLTSPQTGGGIAFNPLQCALVVSLHTGLAGKRFNGRFYLPLTGLNFTSSTAPAHQLLASATTALATVTATWLTSSAAITLAGSATVPCIAVPGPGVPPAPITSVSVDSIPDTQRRRRNKLVAVNQGTHSVP